MFMFLPFTMFAVMVCLALECGLGLPLVVSLFVFAKPKNKVTERIVELQLVDHAMDKKVLTDSPDSSQRRGAIPTNTTNSISKAFTFNDKHNKYLKILQPCIHHQFSCPELI